MPGPEICGEAAATTALRVAADNDPLCERCIALFAKKYGRRPDAVVCGPGRVNLIGEHTDYQMGFVFPMALDRKTVIAASLNQQNSFRIYSEELDDSIEFPSLPAAPPSPVEWWCYVVGTIQNFCKVTSTPVPTGIEIAISTNVPLGGGLSSSAALEIATCTAMEVLYGKTLDPVVKAESVCQKAEHEWAKMPCGLMDQAISTLGVANHAMLFDCQSKEAKYAPMSNDVAVLIIDSGVRHKLVDGHYAARKAKCQEAVDCLRKKYPNVTSLRGVTIQMLDDAVKSLSLSSEAFKRATHVVNECSRCLRFADHLNSGNWTAAGSIMLEGHDSLSQIYDVCVPETDQIVDIAKKVKGVYGARQTGGGFGGCVVVLVDAAAAQEVEKAIMAAYTSYFEGRRETLQAQGSAKVHLGAPSCFVAKASNGAHVYSPKQ